MIGAENAACRRLDYFPCFGELHNVLISMKQSKAKFIFEFLNLLCDGGLRNKQFLSGLPKTLFICNGKKYLQCSECQRGEPPEMELNGMNITKCL